MLQTVFLLECLCHMICISLLSARRDLFMVLIKQYNSPEPIPCIWGIFFAFWKLFLLVVVLLSLCSLSCNFTDLFFFPQEKRRKKWTVKYFLCYLYLLLDLVHPTFLHSYGVPSPQLWLCPWGLKLCQLILAICTQWLGTWPTQLLQGVAYSWEIFGFCFLSWSREWPLAKFHPRNSGEVFRPHLCYSQKDLYI